MSVPSKELSAIGVECQAVGCRYLINSIIRSVGAPQLACAEIQPARQLCGALLK